jgi:hypothetical protein
MIEFQNLLHDNPLVRVVLNGGHTQLDDATVPFTLRFDNTISQQEPTHVMVISIPHSLYANKIADEEDTGGTAEGVVDPLEKLRYIKSKLMVSGERKIYELSAVNYIQFNKPGKYNLIFILFDYMTKKRMKYFLQKTDHINYECQIDPNFIENKGYQSSVVGGHCEALVEVPEEFFAQIPKTGVKKAWWGWINRWHLTDPVDECQFRQRTILAMTIQPIVYLLGLLLRMILVISLSTIFTVLVISTFLCGLQLTDVWSSIGGMWSGYVLFYRTYSLKQILSDSTTANEVTYKNYIIGKGVVRVFISPIGFCIQLGIWSLYILCLVSYFKNAYSPAGVSIAVFILSGITTVIGIWHLFLVLYTSPFPKIKDWILSHFYHDSDKKKMLSKKVWLLVIRFVVLSAALCLATQIHWVSMLRGITTFTASISGIILRVVSVLLLIFLYLKRKKIKMWFNNTAYTKKLRQNKLERIEFERQKRVHAILSNTASLPQTRSQWLIKNMNINDVPQSVDTARLVAPTKLQLGKLFVKVIFFNAKTKVCRPYAR